MAPVPGGYQELNRHTRVIVDEAQRRHIAVEIVDPVLGELCLRFWWPNGNHARITLRAHQRRRLPPLRRQAAYSPGAAAGGPARRSRSGRHFRSG